MNLKGTLGGIAALALAGVFYTFAFCMVNDVDENAISMEYYYSTETAAFEAELSGEDILPAQPEQSIGGPLPAESTAKPKKEKKPAEDKEEADEKSTEAPAATEAPEKKTAKTETEAEVYEDDDEDYPEELDDTEELDDSEAQEQSVYGSYQDEDEDEPETPETEAPATEAPAPETAEETTAETTAAKQITADKDIFIKLFDGDDTYSDDDKKDNGNDKDNGYTNANTGGETFKVKINGSVQTVDAYDLICRIVYNEMYTSFSDEAIKAQAVAAYSYVKYHNNKDLTPSVIVKNDPPEKIKNLVSSVWGKCCYYNSSVAQTVYMASSSGYTADAENVWGGKVPYLKSVYCPFDADSDPNYGTKTKFSEDSMRSMLESSLGIKLSGDPSNWLTILRYCDGNYVYELSVDGQKVISGRKLRENVTGGKLKSAAFDVYYSDGYFHFTTYGYGHGVGMSQNGANILAKQGYDYEQILKFYFTGIDIR